MAYSYLSKVSYFFHNLFEKKKGGSCIRIPTVYCRQRAMSSAWPRLSSLLQKRNYYGLKDRGLIPGRIRNLTPRFHVPGLSQPELIEEKWLVVAADYTTHHSRGVQRVDLYPLTAH